MQIAVSSNCQTEGVANALMALLPHASLRVFSLPWPLDDQSVNDVATKLDQIDAWVTIAPESFIEQISAKLGGLPFQVIRIPAIGFSAFHPDLCYAKDMASGELTRSHYNSAIGAWCYANDIPIEIASKLFDDNIFKQLGYYEMWEPSVAHLKNLFTYAGMAEEFDAFWWSVRRGGNFMHSINHPHIHALIRLAKIVAMRLGASSDIIDQHVDVHDNLDVTVWPLYPAVAENLGIAGGSYRWTVSQNRYVNGVSSYLDYAFDDYRQQGIEPKNLSILNRDQATIDRVLRSHVETMS